MINSITAGISRALFAEFGDRYEVHMENIEQGLEPPCFLISCLEPSVMKFFGNRYFRRNQFCIHFFPGTGNINRECNGVAERLLWALEYIGADGSIFRGDKMEYRMEDGALLFFVNFDFYIYRQEPALDAMENMEPGTDLKGGSR